MLDVNKPTDQELISQLPSYIREDRTAINSISGSSSVGVTDLTLAGGTTSITVGTDVGSYGFETIIIDSGGASSLAKILGGTQGQVKVFIFQDNDIDIVDGAAADGNFYLNHLPALSNFEAATNDVLAVVNIGGDGDTNYGYWKELYRTIAVK